MRLPVTLARESARFPWLLAQRVLAKLPRRAAGQHLEPVWEPREKHPIQEPQCARAVYPRSLAVAAHKREWDGAPPQVGGEKVRQPGEAEAQTEVRVFPLPPGHLARQLFSHPR